MPPEKLQSIKSIIFWLLVSLITCALSEKIQIDERISADNLGKNIGPFTPGLKKINFDLIVRNGTAYIQIMSEKNYYLFRSDLKQYQIYTILPDTAFDKLYTQTDFANFSEKFYIVILNNNYIDPIHVSGKIDIEEFNSLYITLYVLLIPVIMIFLFLTRTMFQICSNYLRQFRI